MKLTEKDLRILLRPAVDVMKDEAAKRRNAEIYALGWAGLLRAAVKGHCFVPEAGIKERYGRTLRENYPEANRAFLKFAAGYWTFKLLHADLQRDAPDATLTHLFSQLEADTAALFFPTPGPIRIAASKREESQRQVLGDCVPDLDLDDFMQGNPILLRDKPRGWLSRFFGS